LQTDTLFRPEKNITFFGVYNKTALRF